MSFGRDKVISVYFEALDSNMTSVFFHHPPPIFWESCFLYGKMATFGHFRCFCDCFPLQNGGNIFLNYEIGPFLCILSH